ncbi:MAG: hypothetical protein PSV17_08480 [Methylotenera sp.]|uniref:hypothetical protein n=1 Tax=Methylotenera sp. TaxID=2051956 RepID=UPI0024877E56|nr:hypothetical protein [Methylotenera sp.]MDI1309457.1 hypothetical protein [Methylotenera sp.]
MMGLMVLMFFAVYLWVSIFITKKAASWAKTNNKKPWLWGGLAAFVMYNLVFWDLIPTLVMHKYYCETQAGFWVYKTPEQWKKEHYQDYKQMMNGLDRSSIEGYKAYMEFEKKYLLVDLNLPNQKIIHAIKLQHTIVYDTDVSGKKTAMMEIKNFLRGTPLWNFNTFDELRQSLGLGWGNRQCELNGINLSKEEQLFFKELANWEDLK